MNQVLTNLNIDKFVLSAREKMYKGTIVLD